MITTKPKVLTSALLGSVRQSGWLKYASFQSSANRKPGVHMHMVGSRSESFCLVVGDCPPTVFSCGRRMELAHEDPTT